MKSEENSKKIIPLLGSPVPVLGTKIKRARA